LRNFFQKAPGGVGREKAIDRDLRISKLAA
jgi:hypothetical protein